MKSNAFKSRKWPETFLANVWVCNILSGDVVNIKGDQTILTDKYGRLYKRSTSSSSLDVRTLLRIAV